MRQSDEYGKTGGAGVIKGLKEIGGAEATEEVFNATDTDFTPQLLRIRDFGADVLVIYGYPAASAIAMRQAKQLNVPVQIIGSAATTSKTFPKTVGEAAAGIRIITTGPFLPESDEPAVAEFRRAFENRFPDLVRQGRPELSDLLAYNGAKVLLEGIRRTGKNLTRDSLIAALESIKEFDTGLSNPTTFGPNRREGNRSGFVLEIQGDLSRKVLPIPVSAD